MISTDFQIQDLLRSINIVYDADQPTRISHFQPTSKSLALLRSLLAFTNERAFFISAPYGTGKSIAHAYLLHTVENSMISKPVLTKLASKVMSLDQELGDWLNQRIDSNNSGVVIALQGYQENLAQSIGDAFLSSIKRLGNEPFQLYFEQSLNFSTLTKALNSIKKIIDLKREYGLDRIVIIWDEFGRHLESLIAEGRTSELNNLQTIAEFISRIEDIPITLSLLLHQSLMNYAGKVPQTIKREWKKVEGRFDTIQYIDDSKEIYKLLANVIKQRRNIQPNDTSYAHVYHSLQSETQIFKDFSELELVNLINDAYPVDPVTLYLLPRVSSRIAQHERTLFTFLNSLKLDSSIGLSDLYDYFSISMSADTSIGGTYHQWLESESALSKLEDETDIKVIKAACLLGIGITGARQRASMELLRYSLLRFFSDDDSINITIQTLIDKKLLLYRKNTNSVSIWHGTDLDIRGKLEEEKARLAADFDSIAFLRSLMEPQHWKAVEHNSTYKITRYLRGEYLDVSSLKNLLQTGIENSLVQIKSETEIFEDGRLFYVLPQSEEELLNASILLKSYEAKHDQVMFALPKNYIDISDMALEVYSYLSMQDNPQLTEKDPLILPELQQLADDAMDYLQRIVNIAITPSEKGPTFFYNSQEYHFHNSIELRKFISVIFDKIFHATPKFNNEMINRRFPRTNLINARKKLILSILEQTGEKNLRLEGFTPNVSFYRALLLNSGLYGPIYGEKTDGEWVFRLPEQIDDPGLKCVWQECKDFLTIPGEKSLSKFFQKLKSPPFGLRDGILPILFASALRAFPSALSLTDKKGEYLPDILASDIETLVTQPDNYNLVIPQLDDTRINYLKTIISIFDPTDSVSRKENDLLRKAYDSIELWKTHLPKASLQSRRVSDLARDFQTAIRRPGDPSFLLFKSIPGKMLRGMTEVDFDLLEKRIRLCKSEIENVSKVYFDTARQSMLAAFQLKTNSDQTVITTSSAWLDFFDLSIISEIKDGTARAFLSRLQNPYDKDEILLNSLSSLLRGKDIDDWDDSDIIGFDKAVQDVVHRIEEFMMNKTDQHSLGDDIKQNLAQLAFTRMENLREKIIDLVGPDKAKEFIERL